MENQNKFDELAYKKAKKRVKEVTNYYWFLAGYTLVAVVLLFRPYDSNIFNVSRDYIIWMLILQGIFLAGYGLYLFVPSLNHWEERKIQKLMDKKKNSEQ